MHHTLSFYASRSLCFSLYISLFVVSFTKNLFLSCQHIDPTILKFQTGLSSGLETLSLSPSQSAWPCCPNGPHGGHNLLACASWQNSTCSEGLLGVFIWWLLSLFILLIDPNLYWTPRLGVFKTAIASAYLVLKLLSKYNFGNSKYLKN